MNNEHDMIRRGDAKRVVNDAFNGMPNKISDAIAALPAVTVGVKPLVWKHATDCRYLDWVNTRESVAETPLGTYRATLLTSKRVSEKVRGKYRLSYSGGFMRSVVDYDTAEAAKAAAQADYEARILAALEPKSAPTEPPVSWVLERCDDGSETVLDWYSGGADLAGEFGRMGLRREWGDGRVEYRTYSADGPWGDARPVAQPTLAEALAVPENPAEKWERTAEEAFTASVWDALKADANDLRKQQRILKAFRAALKGGAA